MEISNTNSKNKPAFYGFRKAFIQSTELSVEAKFLLIDLMTYKGMHAECWPSQAKLSRDIGRNKDSVRKYLKELISNGHLMVRSRGIGRSILYAPSYWKISSGQGIKTPDDVKVAEETKVQPTESTLNRSIDSKNKDNTLKGIELCKQTLREHGLIRRSVGENQKNL